MTVALAARPAATAPHDVRAWYADGQVWVVWADSAAAADTMAVYSSPVPFTGTGSATLVGRLFPGEWSGERLRHVANDTTATWVVPDGSGGTYALAGDEGLFVQTVLASGSAYYGVAAWGDTSVAGSVTAGPVTGTMSLSDPVECHLQRSGVHGGYPFALYAMWAHGQDDQDGGRPDFPVMANAAKNGAPHVFIVSTAPGGPGPAPRPCVWFLHGGDGSARQSYPDSRPELGLAITRGFLVAHDDHLVRVRGPIGNLNTWHFGWRKNYDPFAPEATPAPGDTVVNYTQRRYLWINDWMIARLGVDRDRVSVMGHSVGSSGTTQIAKAYPAPFATAGVFNNGFGGPIEDHPLVGNAASNLPTNLRDGNGATVHMAAVWDLHTAISPVRDLPLFRVFDGKDDINPTMGWDSLVTANYRAADAAGWGMHLYWDERAHGLEGWDGHWSHGTDPDSQTWRDDAAYQMTYASNQAFPAFHGFDGGAYGDPGDGNPADGDDWGTWGGYHDWVRNTLLDTPSEWSVEAFLRAGGASPVDSCPLTSIVSDVSIRRPQLFTPPPGSSFEWFVIAAGSGDTLQQGGGVVAADGLVTADSVRVPRDPARVRLVFRTIATGIAGDPVASGPASTMPRAPVEILDAAPNPFAGETVLHYALGAEGRVTASVFDLAGRRLRTIRDTIERTGTHHVRWDGRDARGARVAPGAYVVRIEAGEHAAARLILRVE